MDQSQCPTGSLAPRGTVLQAEEAWNQLSAFLPDMVTQVMFWPEADTCFWVFSREIEEIQHWCLRFEFQKRGTIHVHVVCWLQMLPGHHPEQLTGNSNVQKSRMVDFLESIFQCSVDVQGGQCRKALLNYVTGYVTKASDSLKFRSKDRRDVGGQEADSIWKQIYRMLCKRSPLEQEMAMDMAGQSMVLASFTGAYVHAPIPGSQAVNHDRHLYNAFQDWLKGNTSLKQTKNKADEPQDPEDCHAKGGEADLQPEEETTQPHRRKSEPPADPKPEETNFLEWCRYFDIASLKPTDDTDKYPAGFSYELRRRNVAGRGSGKACAVAMQFPYELLDIFVGAWAATFKKSMLEKTIWPVDKAQVPENMVHLAANLKPKKEDSQSAWDTRVAELTDEAADDLEIRGV